jgi:RNA polymerase sigma-70 factor (ECF subfamily)
LAEKPDQDRLYREVADRYAIALERLAKAYEADAEKRRDLIQEIHIALWRSLANFNGACSTRTWVYRVAHNTATSHVLREQRRKRFSMVSLEEIQELAERNITEPVAHNEETLERLQATIRRLKPLDRQVLLSYLEGMDAASIGEITGLSAGNVATKIHRIKEILSRQFHDGGANAE